MKHLVLFTTNHPFTFTGGETMFVAPELPHLASAFQSLRIVPLHDAGDELAVPAGTLLDRTLAARWRRRRALHYLGALRWPGFWRELRHGLQRGGWVGAARVWRWAAVADATWAWLRSTDPQAGVTLFYTYWRGGQSLAAARWAALAPGRAAVTRVHGYDLYAHAFSPAFQPWVSMYGTLARVVCVSQHGLTYLQGQGVAPARLLLSRLGVAGAERRTLASQDGAWRIVSCSSVIDLKRVDLMADVLAELARRWPQRRFDWTHFGDGPLMHALHARVQRAPPNLHVVLAGQVANGAVRAHYADCPVDLFVLLSRSEGLPVSIQEALAAGIPVLASDVGGVAEAVPAGGENGALVAADASIDDIVGAMDALLFEPDAVRRDRRRSAAWQRWASEFDAARNHARLARQLLSLLDD